MQAAAVGMLNIYDIMFVPVNIATRKWRVLKVTPQMATLQVEFADYDCHVERCRSNNKVTCKHTTNH